MLHPSYSELIDILNSDSDTDNQITSRYTIVIAAAKRARQLVEGSPTATGAVYNDKAVSTAVSEMNSGKIKIMLSAQAQKENRDFDASMEFGLRLEERHSSLALNIGDIDDDDETDEYEIEEEIDMVSDSELLVSLGLDDDDLDDEGLDKVSFEEELEKEMFDDEDDIFDDDDTYGE